ncbi:MAG TPA: J domain-containing protein [Hyphomicrobiaceae bacterium]|nr:J domain-containing protein [Hyphomicrobiaceae bacterium]
MFERNKVDNSLEQAAIGVEITMDGGEVLSGKLAIPMSRSLFEVLNSQVAFLDFEPYDGDRRFLAKTAVKAVRLVGGTKAASLESRLIDLDGFDPWRVLGVPRGSSFDIVRQAFHAKAKTYHPDRYASADLPAEVRDYLAAQVRRINEAHRVLEQGQQAEKRATAARAEPIYTSARRA